MNTEQMPTNVQNAKQEAFVEVTIRRVRLDRQGYEKDGQYFGTGQPLYHAIMELLEADHKFVDVFENDFRANDIAEARRKCVEWIKYSNRMSFAANDIRFTNDYKMGQRMRDAYQFAQRNPGWHSYKSNVRRTIAALVKMGYVSINEHKQFCLCRYAKMTNAQIEQEKLAMQQQTST